MQRRHELMPTGPRLTGTTEHVVLVVATALMLGGAILMLADVISAGIAIPLIAVGIALVAIDALDRRRGR
jgi:hypothetical protein